MGNDNQKRNNGRNGEAQRGHAAPAGRYAVWAAGGAAAGFALAGWLGRKQGTEILARIIASQMHAATWGPVIAVGLGSAASIACAAAIPYAVLRALDHNEPQSNKKERKQDEED